MLLVDVFCGIDWAEDHYDVALVDQAGVVLTERRIDDDAIGYQLLLELLAEHGDDQVEPIPVAIETPRGLVVACLRRTGRQVYAINPLSVARYRERHSVARTKSDRVDAQLLANILRTDRAAHRPLPADSELAQRSPCWRVLNKMPSGTASRSPTNSAHCCVSTIRHSSKLFRAAGRVDWRIRMPAPSWQLRRLQLRPPA
jgi:transposase